MEFRAARHVPPPVPDSLGPHRRTTPSRALPRRYRDPAAGDAEPPRVLPGPEKRAERQVVVMGRPLPMHPVRENVLEEIIALEVEIEDAFNTYRACVRGQSLSDNEIDDLLLTSNYIELRREVWEASKTVGAEIAERIRSHRRYPALARPPPPHVRADARPARRLRAAAPARRR